MLLALVGVGLRRVGFFKVADALVGIRDGAVDLALSRDVPAPAVDLGRDVPAPVVELCHVVPALASADSAAIDDRPMGMGGDSPKSFMGISSGPCTLADSSPMSMSICPSCNMASCDERLLPQRLPSQCTHSM